MVAGQGLTFPVLRDEDGKVMRDYGLVNPDRPTVPHPAVVIVDRHGAVRWVHLDEDYRRRPTPDQVLEALRGLGEDDVGSEGR
jgi:peroxiredoxin